MKGLKKRLLTPIDEVDDFNVFLSICCTLICIYFGYVFLILIPNEGKEEAKEQARITSICNSHKSKTINTLVSTGNNRRPAYYKLMCISKEGYIFDAE